jgi:hypothetical protein
MSFTIPSSFLAFLRPKRSAPSGASSTGCGGMQIDGTAENRSFRMHPDLLYSVIKAQAGSLEKAVLELIMNSIDAHAKKIEIEVSEDRVSVKDDGRGFKDRRVPLSIWTPSYPSATVSSLKSGLAAVLRYSSAVIRYGALIDKYTGLIFAPMAALVSPSTCLVPANSAAPPQGPMSLFHPGSVEKKNPFLLSFPRSHGVAVGAFLSNWMNERRVP